MSKHKPGDPRSASTRTTGPAARPRRPARTAPSSARTGPRPSAREQARAALERENDRRRSRRIVIAIAAVVVLALVGGGIGLQLWRSRKAPDAIAVQTVAQLNAQVTPVDGQPLVLGNANAPVTVSLYEDFHCPHCAEFEQRYGSILTDAQMAGRIKIELYPMAFIDDGSARAANALACAAEAGFPQTYYLGLFANHDLDWNTGQLISLAGLAGGSATPQFSQCVTDGTHAGWVESINTAANANGVSSTPSLFIDGRPVDVGTLTDSSLRELIDAAARS